jgi:RNA polymerase I-specific transcription initiation factor RRN3
MVFLLGVLHSIGFTLVSLTLGSSRYSNIPAETVFILTHQALMKILRLIPLGPSFIMPILAQHLPHKSQDLQNQVFYVKSLLYMAEYVPTIKTQLFGLIIDLLVQVDIDIHIDDLDKVIAEDDGLFEMELELKDTFSESRDTATAQSDTESDQDIQLTIISDSKLMVSKLDTLMCIVMDYIQSLFQKCQTSGDFEDFSAIFDGLLESFNRIMLPTHKLRSTQFIIFYTCSLVPDTFPEDFMGLLVTHLITISHSSVSRMAASAYLGSFIARAKFVQLGSVRKCLALLNHQCQEFVDAHENNVKGHFEVLSIFNFIRLIDLGSCMLLYKLFCIFFVFFGSS